MSARSFDQLGISLRNTLSLLDYIQYLSDRDFCMLMSELLLKRCHKVLLMYTCSFIYFFCLFFFVRNWYSTLGCNKLIKINSKGFYVVTENSVSNKYCFSSKISEKKKTNHGFHKKFKVIVQPKNLNFLIIYSLLLHTCKQFFAELD